MPAFQLPGPALPTPSPRYTLQVWSPITHHLPLLLPLLIYDVTTRCLSPTKERRICREGSSCCPVGRPVPQSTAWGPLSEGRPLGGVSRCHRPPLFHSWWVPAWLRGLEMLSPKSLTSLGHWLNRLQTSDLPAECLGRASGGSHTPAQGAGALAGAWVRPGTEPVRVAPDCGPPEAYSQFQADFLWHLQQPPGSFSVARWYFPKNIHQRGTPARQKARTTL